jgi:hypothetical protein
VDNTATAWSARITAKAQGERFNLGHERLSDAGGGLKDGDSQLTIEQRMDQPKKRNKRLTVEIGS